MNYNIIIFKPLDFIELFKITVTKKQTKNDTKSVHMFTHKINVLFYLLKQLHSFRNRVFYRYYYSKLLRTKLLLFETITTKSYVN